MGYLVSMGSCPFCRSGNNTPCFATYTDGFFCFTCGKRKSSDGNAFAFRPTLVNSNNKRLELPEHTMDIRQFSPSVLEWLYKYYVYDDLIRKYNISYCEYVEFGQFKGESILLPVIDCNQLISYQRRFFPDKMFISRGDKTHPFFIQYGEDYNNIYIVEDYISAIRLGEYTNVVCLQGTSMSWNCLKMLEKTSYDIHIWLDPDEAGEKASVIIRDKLQHNLEQESKFRAFAVRESRSITIRSTDKQPKELNNHTLKQIIGVTK